MLKGNDYGTYFNLFDTKTGYFIRKEHKGCSEALWCPEGPEMADISITDYCPLSCDYCYRESNSNNAAFMTVSDFKFILEEMLPHIYQVAIGGGSPQHHPQFVEILRTAHALGVVPNYTTNGLDMTPTIIKATKDYCGAVAVSMHNFEQDFKTVERLLKEKVRTSIHVVLTKPTIAKWCNELAYAKTGNGVFGGKYPLHSCVFLMHKPKGRGTMEQHPTYQQKQMFCSALEEYAGDISIGVDSCCTPTLIHFMGKHDALRYVGPCDSGMFSVYVDENLVVSPCSFNDEVVYDLHDLPFDYIWKEMFKEYREQVWRHCPDCAINNQCKGCSVFPEINPCNSVCREGC